MASLISWLAASGARDSSGNPVSSGYAWFFQPGGTSSDQEVVFSDADGLIPLTQPVRLDAGGRAVVYSNTICQVVIQTSTTASVRTHDRGNSVTAAQVEIENDVATGTSLTTGSQVVGGRTDLDVFLTNLHSSLGATNGQVDMSGTAVPIKDAIKVLTHWFDVTSPPYSAAGDGVTSDTTAIQAAITAANASGGGIVFFPPGTYVVSSLTIPANVSLMGCGPGRSIISTSSAAEVLLVASGAFLAYGIKFKTTGKGLLRFTAAVGNGTVFTACAFACTSAVTTGAGVISGSDSVGIGYTFINLLLFTGCDFVQTGTGGTRQFAGDGCTLSGCTMTFVSGRAFGGDYVRVADCYIEYQGAVAGTLHTVSLSSINTMLGTTIATSGGGALNFNSSGLLYEFGTDLVVGSGDEYRSELSVVESNGRGNVRRL